MMHLNAQATYPILYEYIHELVGDKIVALRVVNLLIRADIPLHTFVTTAKLYKVILNRVNRMRLLNCCAHMCDDGLRGDLQHRQMLCKDELDVLRDQYLVFVACCVISSKYYRDVAFTNESWESVSETEMRRLNEAERVCLISLDYRVSGQGDAQVHDAVSDILRNSGMVLSRGRNLKGGRLRSLMRKILCFS